MNSIENFVSLSFIHLQNHITFGRKLSSFSKYYDENLAHLESILKEVLYFLNVQRKDLKVSHNYKSIVGLLDFLLMFKSSTYKRTIFSLHDYTIENLIETIEFWSDKIHKDYLEHDQLPPFDNGFIFHNSGLLDGVAGLGYFYLRLYDSTNLPSAWALTLLNKDFL